MRILYRDGPRGGVLRVVATYSVFLSVGYSEQGEPTVNQKQIDRGYHYHYSSS